MSHQPQPFAQGDRVTPKHSNKPWFETNGKNFPLPDPENGKCYYVHYCLYNNKHWWVALNGWPAGVLFMASEFIPVSDTYIDLANVERLLDSFTQNIDTAIELTA